MAVTITPGGRCSAGSWRTAPMASFCHENYQRRCLRDAAGISAGAELEIEIRDGRIEIEPAPTPMRVIAR
jgi:hypothetical protein